MAVDWGRRPYTTKARFWDHPDAPLVDIVWYFTDLPFLPFPTVFNSKDWDEEPWLHNGLGEVYGAPRVYNGREVTPGLTGGHICGTREDFEQGPTWPPTGEPLTYGPDGIPTCCPRNPVGFVAGGARPEAIVTLIPPSPPPPPYYTALAIAGARPDAIVTLVPPSPPPPPPPLTYTALVTSGGRPAADVTLVPPPVPPPLTYTALVMSGGRPAADVTLVPPPPPPPPSTCPLLAPTCSSAPYGDLDVCCPYIWSGDDFQWRAWEVDPEAAYRFQFNGDVTGSIGWTLSVGSSCGDTEVAATGTGASLPVDSLLWADGGYWYLVVLTSGGSSLNGEVCWIRAYGFTCDKVVTYPLPTTVGGYHRGLEFTEWFRFGPIDLLGAFRVRVNAEVTLIAATIYVGPTCPELGAIDEFAAGSEWHEYTRTWDDAYIWITVEGPNEGGFSVSVEYTP